MTGASRIRAWAISARPFAVPWMLANTLAGSALAGFSAGRWLPAFAVTTCVLLYAHFLNNWRDFARGVDRPGRGGSRAKPHTAASQLLPRGLLTVRETQASAAAFLALAALLFVLFAPARADAVLVFLLGVASASLYTDVLKPRKVGEVGLFLGHGLGTTALAYSFARPLDAAGLAAGFLLGAWAAGVYAIDQWMDITDLGRRARSVAEMIFASRLRISSYWWFLATMCWTLQAGFVLMGLLPGGTMLTVLALPLAHVTGVVLDYSLDRGIPLALACMWLFALLMAAGAALP
jgi:1,4-dihydroxy-2-naphthoate octaprenyltransferase